MGKIKVHEKALAHLSRGLYRSPASALRELVSNAWDANAREVLIDTAAPGFAQLTIQDDGDGFTKDEFVRLMDGGIGNSEKRPRGEPLINERPTIGRLGIGMLGIAQICGGFSVTSCTASGEAFRARIKLYDLIKEKLDRNDREVIRTAGGVDRTTEVDVGEYHIERNFDGTGLSKGTTILADDVHPTFVHTFRETYTKPPVRWTDYIKQTSKHHSIQELGDYWRLLWELGASCPIPYVSDDALPDRVCEVEQRRLKSYDFRVVVDGVELRKPVRLQRNPGGYTVEVIAEESHRVFGRDVRFHGYIVVQEGSQVRPDELRGVMLRVNEVGIGLYDPSMLDYRYNEGPRSRWVTSELFITAGLEDALNIDRDSFNRFHPEFRLVQKRVHEILHRKIFPQVYKKIEERSRSRLKGKAKGHEELLRQVVQRGTDAETVSIRTTAAATEDAAPTVRASAHRLDLSLPAGKALPTKKSQQELASAILALFEVSLLERTTETRRQKFRTLLFELLAKW